MTATLPSKTLQTRQNVSKKYLEQIIPVLNRTEFLNANRGYQGGYKLAKEPDQYKIGDILKLTEGSIAPVACLDHDPRAVTEPTDALPCRCGRACTR